MKKEDAAGRAGEDPRIAYFHALAPTWDVEGPSGEGMIACLREHSDLLALAPGHDLLEVGCGTGKTTGWLAAAVAPGRVTAVDFAPGMIEHARRKGIDAEFRCADACGDDLGRGDYDVALCLHSFPHFRDQPAALVNLRRALKPGGRLIVMHTAGSRRINEFHAGLDGPVRGDRLPPGDAWAGLLEQAGLVLERLIDTDDLFFLEASRTVT